MITIIIIIMITIIIAHFACLKLKSTSSIDY